MIPKFYEMFADVLDLLKNNEIWQLKDIVEGVRISKNVTQDEANQRYEKSNVLIFYDRVTFTLSRLLAAKLIERIETGKYKITDRGLKAINEDKDLMINEKYLFKYEEFMAWKDSFKKHKNNNNNVNIQTNFEDTMSPNELISHAFSGINNELKTTLYEKVSNMNNYDFERLCTYLIIKMGYGELEQNKDAVTQKARDGGIDGIVKADKFGLDNVYIQSKKWNIDTNPVGSKEIRDFIGSMDTNKATKGVFITTSRFTDDAYELINKSSVKIALVDFDRLTDLLIEYNVGVEIEKTYEVKRINNDFFDDEIYSL